MRELALIVMIAGAIPACDGESANTPDEVRTSVDTVGGIERVLNTGTAPRLETRPLLTLGEMGGVDEGSPEEFGRVRSVLADGSGAIYVGDGMARRIVVFDSTGDHLRTLGQRGGGPGELENVQDVAWFGDTLVVMDGQNARLTHLTRDGQYAGQWPFMRASGPPVRFYSGAPGELYSFAMRIGRDEEGRASSESVWARFTRQGPADSLPRPESRLSPEFERCEREGMLSFFNNPFAEELLARPAPGGQRAVAYSSEYRVAFLDPAGDTVRVISRDAEPAPLTDEEWAEALTEYEEWKERFRGGDCQGGIERPADKPLLLGLHFTHDGRLLVEYETADGEAFDLYDGAGRWTATLPLPGGGRDESVAPFLRDDRLYLVTRDSLDVQRVQVYAIERGSAD